MPVDQKIRTEDNVKRGKVFALPAQPDNTLRRYTDERYRPSISKNKDQGSFRLVTTDQSNLGLWEQAWEQVKAQEEDWEHWPQFCGVKDLKTKDVVTEVHSFARRRRDEAEKHQGHVFGTSLTYRRLCSKVATCAKKFEVVGDLVVQAEPVYAALPWTLVRFVIECAVGENETWDSMLEGTEIVTTHISKYPVIEQLYAKMESELSRGLRDSLLKFFVLILTFQIHTIKYFDPDHKGSRTISGMNPVTADKIKKELQTIQTAKDRVDKDIVLVDAEVTKRGIDNLIEGHEGQQEQLAAIKEGIKALSLDLDGEFSEAERNQQARHKDLIEMWKGPLDEMKHNREVERETYYLAAVRNWLSAANPWENHQTAKDQRPMRLGKWLANEFEFKSWQTSRKSSILWLHGFAGTGKTGLVCRVIEDLRQNLEDQETGQNSRRLAIFYCSNDKAKSGREEIFSKSDPKEALRSIVSQLATTKQGRYVAPILREKFDASGLGSDVQMPLDYSDCVEILVQISRSSPITIVLDAFDECDQDKSPALIKHLKDIIHHSPDHVKIFISTRSFPAIENELKADPSIEVTEERNKDDVCEFIEATLDKRVNDKELLNSVVEPELTQLRLKVRDTLISRAQNMFLYASLLLNRLCDNTRHDDAESISKKLDELPRNLVEMYNRIMEEIHDDKNNSPRSCRLAQDTFKWLLCAQNAERPLEYRSLLEAISPPDRKADLVEILTACRTLVVKEAETIKFAHYSVREHVVKMVEYSPSQCNIVVTRSCLRILNTYFGADASTRNELSEPERLFADYALLYWPLHYEGIAQNDLVEHRTAINAMLRSFLLVKGGGREHKYKVYEDWFRNAQKMAEPLKGSKYRAKLNALRADPPNPLFAACVFGLEDLIARFGRELNGLNRYNKDGQNALCLAIENNKLETVKALLSRRFPADINLLNISAVQQFEDWNPAERPKTILYASAMQCAAAIGNLEIATFLIEQGAHIDLVAGYFGSPLQAACLMGHGVIAELLLKKGAEPNSQGGFHGNALQAAAAGGHSDIINLLLENKPPALVSTPGGHYGSVLMAAVCSGSSDTVSLLLEEEADPNVRRKLYGSPLEKAVSMGRAAKNVVEVLLEYEADADLSPTNNEVHMIHQAAMYGMDDLVNYCLDKGCQINMITTKGPEYNLRARLGCFPHEMTPLGYASVEGNLAVVKILLERGAPFEEDRPHSAPLWAAALQGHADVVDLLIRKFRNMHNEEETIAFMDHLPDPDAGGHFILFAAASSGSADVVKVLLDHDTPYRSNWFGATPLHATTRFQCAAVTKILLDYHENGKIDVCLDKTNGHGNTALFQACAGNQADIASQLLEIGANPLIPNNQKSTTLHVACHHDNRKLVEMLINKASENLDDQQLLKYLDSRHEPTGNTALMDCADRNRLSSLIVLLDRGADPLIRNNENLTALHFACRQDNTCLVQRLVDKALEKTDESGFLNFINQQPSSHMTALIECAAHNRLEALNLLLEHNADYTLHGHFGNNPLLWASGKGHYAIVKALVDHAKRKERERCPFKDFLNHKNKDGKNALFEPARNKHLDVVNLLLHEGIDWSIVKKDGVTALHSASWQGNPEVVSALCAKAYEASSPEVFNVFLNRRNYVGKTALLDAADRGRIRIVKELVEKYNADYLITNNKECSALNLACWFGRTKVVSFLLTFASKNLPRERFLEFVNHCNAWGKTAFMDASESNRLDIVKILLEPQYGVDYRLPNNDSVTPFQMSSWHGNTEVAACILKTASNTLRPEDLRLFVNHRNKWGKTTLLDAAERNRPDAIVQLLAHSADYAIADNHAFTALHYAAHRNHLPALRALLERASADHSDRGDRFKRFLNQQSDTNRATALRDAVCRNHADAAHILLAYGPAYGPVDGRKRTVLHYAVANRNGPLGIALLEFAARDSDKEAFRRFVNARDEAGETAWEGANRLGLPRLVQRLKGCGVLEGA